MADTTIHYSTTLSLIILKSQGQGECGTSGYISGYHGMITCKNCLVIVAKEKAQSFASVKNGLK